MQLSQEYGPVFSLRIGSQRMVFVSGYKMVKEALVIQLDSFIDRPIFPLFHAVFKGIGEYTWTRVRKPEYLIACKSIAVVACLLQGRT